MRALTIAVLFALTVTMPAQVAASTSKCYFDEGRNDYVCVTKHQATGGPNLSIDLDGPGPLPLRWSRYRIVGLPAGPIPCLREFVDGTTTVTEVGIEWIIIVHNTNTGEIIAISPTCEWPGDPSPPPPPDPLPLPSEIAIANGAPLRLQTHVNPPVEGVGGVSQLDTWFWCDQPDPVRLAAAVTGARSSAVVELTGLTWSIEGPDGRVERTAPACGSEPEFDSDGAAAAAVWTPNLPGDYSITLAATWSGSWTVQLLLPRTGWTSAGTFSFDPVTITSEPIGYHVVEIQTVGRPANP